MNVPIPEFIHAAATGDMAGAGALPGQVLIIQSEIVPINVGNHEEEY